MKKIFFLFFLIFTFRFFATDILSSDRNIFGIHLTQLSDINKAHKIINSSGGNWGWATIVIRQDQMNFNQWQDFFNQCRKNHIIPIIRIATMLDNNNWKKPTTEYIDQVTSFLNSLNWPTKVQHVILFNEVNHASEWGGEINIKEFGDISIYAAKKLKEKNENFYLISGAPDLASPDKLPDHISASTFYSQIIQNNPDYFSYFDALASHSYPNHGYIGKPSDTGQHSIHGYEWELGYLKKIGVNKNLPIFITETGWPHREGDGNNNSYYTADTGANFLIDSLNIWNKDSRIIAVTPFTFNYPNKPFDNFSWLDKNEQLYSAYNKVVSLEKPKNQPEQVNSYHFEHINLPLIIFPERLYEGYVVLKNTGQSIWGNGESQLCFDPIVSKNISTQRICTGSIQTLPGDTQKINFTFQVNSASKTTEVNYISWADFPHYELISFSPTASIYHPKSSLREKLFEFVDKIFHLRP